MVNLLARHKIQRNNYSRFLEYYFEPYANLSYEASVGLLSRSKINTALVRFSANDPDKLYFCYRRSKNIIEQILLMKISNRYLFQGKIFDSFTVFVKFLLSKYQITPPTLWTVLTYKLNQRTGNTKEQATWPKVLVKHSPTESKGSNKSLSKVIEKAKENYVRKNVRFGDIYVHQLPNPK